jgi:hypothetical protein
MCIPAILILRKERYRATNLVLFYPFRAHVPLFRFCRFRVCPEDIGIAPSTALNAVRTHFLYNA